jgi:hypothetical protein
MRRTSYESLSSRPPGHRICGRCFVRAGVDVPWLDLVGNSCAVRKTAFLGQTISNDYSAKRRLRSSVVVLGFPQADGIEILLAVQPSLVVINAHLQPHF